MATRQFYDEFLGPAGFGPMPSEVEYYCCGQFAVSRQNIQAHNRSFYRNMLMFFQSNTIKGNHHVDKVFVMGDVLTTYWPMIFGEKPSIAPAHADCELFVSPGCSTLWMRQDHLDCDLTAGAREDCYTGRCHDNKWLHQLDSNINKKVCTHSLKRLMRNKK